MKAKKILFYILAGILGGWAPGLATTTRPGSSRLTMNLTSPKRLTTLSSQTKRAKKAHSQQHL